MIDPWLPAPDGDFGFWIDRLPAWVALLKRVRRLIETVIGQLVGRFSIEKIWARDLWHLTSRINRKLLAHTLCRWLNRHRADPLQLDQIHRSFSCTSRKILALA